MNNFEKIKNLKNEFSSNISDKEEFKNSIGLLKDFGNYLKKNKGLLIGLIGVALINVSSQAAAPIIKNMQETQITQNINELDISEALKDFQKDVEINNSIVNTRFIETKVKEEINAEHIKDLLSMEINESVLLKNPFVKNQVLKINITESGSTHLSEKSGLPNFSLNNENKNILLDKGEQQIFFNIKDFKLYANNFAQVKNEKETLDLAKYIIYHEAAHATRRQSEHLDQEAFKNMRHVEIEMHSDISALLLLAKENNSIEDFNRVIDTIIKNTVSLLDNSSNDHSTAYGLIEFKKVINENQELLNINKEDISEFAYRFVKEIQKIDFTNESVVADAKDKLNKDNSLILNDLKNGENLDYINYYFSKKYNKGVDGFKVEDYINKGQIARIERQLPRVIEDVKSEIKHDDFIGLSYLKNKKELEKENVDNLWHKVMIKTIKEIEDKVNENPKIDKNIVNLMKAKIKIDEINYNVEDIKELVMNANNYKKVNEKGIKFEI
jgi:hypothetical protein